MENPSVSVSAETPWLFAIGSNDDEQIRTLRLRSAAPRESERTAMPLLVMIRWPFEAMLAHVPDNGDLEAMAVFENGFALQMDAGGWGSLAAVVTTAGVREWRVYTQDFERFQDGFNQALLGQPQYPLSFELFEDPEWLGYADLAESVAAEPEDSAV